MRENVEELACVRDDIIAGAASLEGASINEKLSAARKIGDINGDRFDDFYVQGSKYSYILFGPVSLSGAANVQDRADLIVNTSDSSNTLANPVLGKLAEGMGDVDGDGLDDMVFYRSIGSQLYVSTIFGAEVLPRDLSKVQLDTSSTPRVRYGLSIIPNWGDAVKFELIDWDGVASAKGFMQAEIHLSRNNSSEVYRNNNSPWEQLQHHIL